MPIYKKKVFITSVIAVIIVSGGLFAVYSYIRATSTPYSYGSPGLTDVEIDSQGEYVYASYCSDDAVVKLSAATMTESDRFTVVNPTLMVISPDDSYLYVLSYTWPGRLYKITLQSGHVDWISLNQGQVLGLMIEPSGDKLWISTAVWPVPGELLAPDDTWDHPDTGRIVEVNTSNLSITRVTTVNAAPVSVWYSAYSDRLYVLHSIPCSPETEPNQELYNRPSLKPVAVYDAQTMEKMGEFYAGGNSFSYYPHVQMTNWDDEGRYLCIPSPGGQGSGFSLRVIDTTTNTVAFDLSLLNNFGDAIGFQFAHKLPGSDYLWTLTCFGLHNMDLEGQGGTAARINTNTREYEFFLVEGWTKHAGDFAVGPDDNTLYIPEIKTGDLFVWSPD